MMILIRKSWPTLRAQASGKVRPWTRASHDPTPGLDIPRPDLAAQ
jgi:hypothetical protein